MSAMRIVIARLLIARTYSNCRMQVKHGSRRQVVVIRDVIDCSKRFRFSTISVNGLC